MDRQDPAEQDFEKVADWSEAYLEQQYSRDVGQTFGRLVRQLARIATAPRDGVDRFDWLKEQEVRILEHLRTLALAIADGDDERRSRAGQAATVKLRDRQRLFVYGTLKRGHSRSVALAGERFIGHAVTAPRYRLFDCGGYPALVEVLNGQSIEGELWEVDTACLTRLDDIEGVALNLYVRRPILLADPYSNDYVESYFYQRSVLGLRDCGCRWP